MEEIGHYAEAERAARQALECATPGLVGSACTVARPRNARTHTRRHLVTGRVRKFLNDYNLFRGHLWWHLAIFKYSSRAFDEVLELLDREIYPTRSSFYLDIQNGASLLLRLEAQGVSVGTERWERLAQGSLQTATQNTVWFTTAHHVLALLRTGRVSAVDETINYANARVILVHGEPC